MRKIILLGYMGCGKSTIAKSLSKNSGIPFVDLDQYIEEKANLTINSIFEQHGEIYFRKLEHQAFVELLNSSEPLIIGLGGGTPCYANNHELLIGENVSSIYLKAKTKRNSRSL
jgi:shikimate kinase